MKVISLIKFLAHIILINAAEASDAVHFECAPGDTGCDVPPADDVPKCGNFIRYHPNTFRILPELKGVVGGVSFNNVTQYVGFANNYCDNPYQIPCPAAIQTAEYNEGAFMFCDGMENQEYFNSHFLQKHKDLKWVDTDVDKMMKLADVLELPGPAYRYYFARRFYQGEYRLGRVHLNMKKVGFYMMDENFQVQYLRRGFQVLTCPRCKNGGKGRFCCKNGADNPDCCVNEGYGPRCTWRCGQQLPMSKFNPEDSKTPGFDAGTYSDGSKVFVGSGYFDEALSTGVARITTTKDGPGAPNGPGAYADDGTYYYDNEDATFFVAHPKLTWRRIKRSDGPPEDAVMNFLNMAIYSEDAFDYFVRVNLTIDGVEYQQIGSYYNAGSKEWSVCFWNGQTYDCYNNVDMDLDILVCLRTYNLK